MRPSSGMSYRVLRMQHRLPQRTDYGNIMTNKEERTAQNAATKYTSGKGKFPRRRNMMMSSDMMEKRFFK